MKSPFRKEDRITKSELRKAGVGKPEQKKIFNDLMDAAKSGFMVNSPEFQHSKCPGHQIHSPETRCSCPNHEYMEGAESPIPEGKKLNRLTLAEAGYSQYCIAEFLMATRKF